MKKLFTLITLPVITAMLVFFGSCQHENLDPCKDITVEIAVTTKSASVKPDGAISATATGGKEFKYQLNDGAFQESGNFTGLAAGKYTLTARNSYGCSAQVIVTVEQANLCAGVTITVSATKKDPASGKSDGTISVSASGGSGFTFSINNGTYQSSGSFANLAAGNYTITAKNSNGCTGQAQVTLATPTNVCAGVTITVTAAKTDPNSGPNGTITATATGSTGLSFSLNGGSYQSGGGFTGLAAGAYTITAKNANGCTGSTSVTLVAANTDPCAGKTITIISSVIGASKCGTTSNNGSITSTASGATGFTYNINNGTYQSGNTFNNLAAGTYTIGAKDAAGCSKTVSVTVENTTAGPLFLDVKTVLLAKCGTCHTTSSSGGVNFTNDCEIVTRWSRIQATTTNGSMPPGVPLTAAEKLKIADWVSAGHTFEK